MIERITDAAAADEAVTTQADAGDGLFQKLHKHSNCTKCQFCSYCQRFYKVADVPSNTYNTFVVIFPWCKITNPKTYSAVNEEKVA